MASLLCGSSHLPSSGQVLRRSCHTLSIWKASLPCGSSHAPSKNLILKRTCHSLCTWMASLLCSLQITLCWEAHVKLCAFEWNLSWLLSGWVFKKLGVEQLLLQFSHLNGFSPEWILMVFQITWCWAALVTLCALEWLLSRIDSLMFLKMASYWEDPVIHWAFKRLLSHVGPLMLLQRT